MLFCAFPLFLAELLTRPGTIIGSNNIVTFLPVYFEFANQLLHAFPSMMVLYTTAGEYNINIYGERVGQ